MGIPISIEDNELILLFNKGLSSDQIADMFKMNRRTVQRRKAKLVNNGLVKGYKTNTDSLYLPKILFFDIETAPLQAWIWGCGKQYVGHKQLVANHDRYRIICITYCWDDEEPAQFIGWGYEEQDTRHVVEEFDKIASGADIIVGKNSDYFDIPMVNGVRLFEGLPGNPTWALATDDLQKQMKKYFRVPSQALDYYSKQLGLGGKIKMEMQNWIDIVEQNGYEGKDSYDKMLKYGLKDIEDTRTLWRMLSEHFDSKFNTARWADKKMICKHADCGSDQIVESSRKTIGMTKYVLYKCNACNRYAGKTTVNINTGKEAAIR